MLITLDWLKEKRACEGGVKYFNKYWPAGEANCQTIRDQLKIKDRDNYASSLMRNAEYIGD